MNASPLISVCVPVYRRHGAPNLGTLAAALGPACDPLTFELVVALNGLSADAAEAPAFARTVDLRVNRGVAPGWNAAAAAATGDILVFANDDAVPHPRSLARLADAVVGDELVGAVGPRGARWDIATGAAGVDVDGARLGPRERAEVECVSGFLFACRRSAYEQVGGFDDFYAPASWEEIDFCTALRAQGYRNYVIGGVDVDHEYGVSRPQPPWRRVRFDGRSELLWSIHRRNRRHFLGKWAHRALPPVMA